MSNVTETPVPHEIAARESLTQLRAIIQAVRGYGFAGATHRRRISMAAALPDRFLHAVAVALDASEALANAASVTGTELRDAVNFTNAYGPLADELQLIADGLRQTVQNARAEAGQRALKTYALAKGFNRPADQELLVPHIANMKETLGRGRPKLRTAPAQTPAAAGTPPGGGNA